ncbi:hypothetical protein CROQUDRAFT_44259 [Cronartium quercuum f. sp. fusiforme G11]|uniref:Peptidase A1 domain-containing protein n=1 Tax=Cronartium quercuum f. sp. fusiforme G11 TaxID=708437 RepID=A0A9P6NLZ8_9BASI|nr:hypothetical protein CROQUDRAFT_44259 [Cronartium quercuum f. sp. fusiforme G11]
MPDTVSTSTNTGFNTKKLNALIDNVITSPGKPTAANSVGVSIEANDVAYFITIEVGTPPQNFNVIMDSGSSDFWLAGPKCTNSNTGENTCGHKSLTTESSSFKPTSTPFQVSYGTGQVSGVLVQEDVNLAGLTLAGHTFGAATSESNDFAAATVPFDGLMGTALSTLSNEKVLTPIESLAKSGKISGAFMGYSLGRSADTLNMGQVTVGGVDANKFEGSLTLIDNVNTRGFWEGAMAKVTVNGKTVLENKTGILDTGTTLIICPPDDAMAVHSAIPGAKSDGQGGFTLPCKTQATVALNFGGRDFSILASDLVVQPVKSNDLEGDCMSGISSGQIGGAHQWLLGDVFLKNVYLATDATNNQIGLAVIKSSL